MTVTALLMQSTAWAQDAATPKSPHTAVADYFFNPLFYLAVFMVLIVSLVVFALWRSVKVLTQQLAPVKETPVAEESVVTQDKRRSGWNVLMDKLTRTVPVSEEKDILLDHNYDDIMELDNQLPPWWKWGFYVTIVFAVFYMLYYHASGSGKLMAAEYKDEMNKAAMEKEVRMKEAKDYVTEDNVAVLTSAGELASGKTTFTTNCVTCHGTQAQGTPIAPNLTDNYWLHGGGIKDVFKTITQGVPGKAMIAWSQKLSPKQINEVASYIFSLQNSKPEGAKQPEGELYAPDTTRIVSAIADTSNPDLKRIN